MKNSLIDHQSGGVELNRFALLPDYNNCEGLTSTIMHTTSRNWLPISVFTYSKAKSPKLIWTLCSCWLRWDPKSRYRRHLKQNKNSAWNFHSALPDVSPWGLPKPTGGQFENHIKYGFSNFSDKTKKTDFNSKLRQESSPTSKMQVVTKRLPTQRNILLLKRLSVSSSSSRREKDITHYYWG